MKLSSLRYLLREGFRNIWQNRFMSIASIGVLISCLLLTGFAYLVFANIDHAFDWVYGQNVVVVFAEPDATEEQTAAMGETIRGITNVQSVEFVSKDEALWKMADDLPENTFEEMQGENNPLQDSFIVSLRDLSQLDATVMQLQKLDKVEDVTYDGDIAETLTRIKQVVMAVGGWIIAMLLLVSLFIIEGIVLGLVSGLLSFGIIAYLYDKLSGMFTFGISFSPLKFSAVWVVLFVGFLVAGTLTGIAGSAISMTKYLKEEGGKRAAADHPVYG